MENHDKKTIKLVQKYELDKVEELVLIEVIKDEIPFALDNDEVNLDKELELREISNINKLRNFFKGFRISVSNLFGRFEGTILTINQGLIYLEVDDFFPESQLIDYKDLDSYERVRNSYLGVRAFGIDDIGELTIKG